MHMAKKRTTLNLDEQLLERAADYSGIQEKTALIHQALTEMVQRGAARRLIAMGGTMPNLKQVPRRRSERVR